MIFWLYLSTAVVNLMNLIVRCLQKNAIIMLHTARLMTRLIRVRPAVDLSWKALVYYNTLDRC